MNDPVQIDKLVVALKCALDDQKLTGTALSRKLGKSTQFFASVMQRVRDGASLTLETVRTLRVELPTLEQHLKAAGWSAGVIQSRATVAATRNTVILRQQLFQLKLKQFDLGLEIEALAGQIADMEGIDISCVLG